MVEKTTHNNDGSAQNEPKKRSRLFGSRRAPKVIAAPEPAVLPQPVALEPTMSAQPTVSEAKVEPSKAEQLTTDAAPVMADAPAKRASGRRASSKPDAAKPDATKPEAGEPEAAKPDTAAVDEKPAVEAPATAPKKAPLARPTTSLLFQAPDLPVLPPRSGARDDDFDDEPRDSRPPRNSRNTRNSDHTEDSDRNRRDDDVEQTAPRRRSRRRAGDEDRDSGIPNTGNSNPTNTVV
ncbi:MAG: hypothetical protein H7201_16410, partial [Candidatus Saccharibacteria bacterium]|nr:hypothetical protein [Microbacteriaceae bacterium]